jgi:epsilon-lactone hydrolase
MTSRPARQEDAPEPLLERFVAAVHRRLLRTLILPTFRAGRPIAQQRMRLHRISRLMLAPRGVEFRATHVGGIPGELVAVKNPPDGSAGRVVLYLHGGAYCVGSPQTHRTITGHLARSAQARVFAADYRLAPEHPFPAALDDAVAAYRGLLAEGHATGSITLAGDSAGGGLALATALRLRSDGVEAPGGLVLFSPWVDLCRQHAEPPARNEVMLSGAWTAECARHYLAGRDAAQPLVSPIGADLRGLPPTLVQVGTDEALFDDSQRLHAALQSAGVAAALQVYPRRWHVFQANAGLLADANRALASAGRFIRARD